ncbi:hypothetical protein U9M48_005870 [Paspalum notatum var. saurae]|uniref:DUF4378 domain-containing protein n=1 Tax=Paspalum notatum var. saurae TaxID=547442 RepID=A0AAQ3SIX5_PASNO
MQTQAVAEGDSSMAVGRKLGTMEDKQQQLSPVSVLDFLPFDDDEGSDAGTCSPAFLRRPIPDLLLQISRTKQQAQRKVGRYDPVEDLDARFATAASESGDSVGASTRLATSSSTSTTDSSGSGATATTAPRHADEEEHQSVGHQHPSPCQEPDGDDECRLLARLLQEGFAERLVDDEVARALVLDFFAEGVADADRRLRSVSRRRRVADEEEALVRAAAEWLRGAGPRWGVADVVLSGKAALADMERGRRWMCVVGQEEERDVGEAVEAMVADTLVEELVAELLVPCC